MKKQQPAVGNVIKMISHEKQAVVHNSVLKNCYGSVTLFAIDDEECIPEHQSYNDEFVCVVDGVIELVLTDVLIIMKKGEMRHISPNTLHMVRGKSGGKIMLIIMRNTDH